MVVVPHKVYVVVDPEFGEQLVNLEKGVPVWIVDTPTNKPVVQRLWGEHHQRTHLTGITLFRYAESSSAEDMLLEELDMIDLHHGSDSADPPYTVLDVIGAPLTARAKRELSVYGFNEFHGNPFGFTARRPDPVD